MLVILFFVLEYAEKRNGFVIERGLLDFIAAPKDYSIFIFTCTYATIVFGLLLTFGNPQRTLLLVRVYLLVQLFRCLLLLLVPLNPPEGIIPLHDPFLQSTFYNGRPNLKDLFFSGHVATLLMFPFILPQKWAKIIVLLLTIVAGSLLVLQRVHYAIDVGAAPLFAFLAFRLAKRWSSV